MIMLLSCFFFLALSILPSASAGGNDQFLSDLEALTDRNDVTKQFDEQTPGFDQRDDMFYFQDNLVDELFKRKKFSRGLITLGGQALDSGNSRAKKSTYPFAVGQRATKSLGVLSDRWDVKDVGDVKNASGVDGLELFALYEGSGKDFVVNKLRAHLLRRLANSIQEFVPILDRSVQDDAQGHEEEVNAIHDEIRRIIENVFAEVDQSIRTNMYDNDDSWAGATVAIVTKSALVTASVGNGQVLGYDESSVIRKLTNFHDDITAKNVFGAKKTRQIATCRPHVEIHSREQNNIQLLLVESPTVSVNMDNYEAFRIILTEVNQHKRNAANEQQMFSSSVSRILEASCNKGNVVSRFFGPTDHTVLLVGLESNYENIH